MWQENCSVKVDWLAQILDCLFNLCRGTSDMLEFMVLFLKRGLFDLLTSVLVSWTTEKHKPSFSPHDCCPVRGDVLKTLNFRWTGHGWPRLWWSRGGHRGATLHWSEHICSVYNIDRLLVYQNLHPLDTSFVCIHRCHWQHWCVWSGSFTPQIGPLWPSATRYWCSAWSTAGLWFSFCHSHFLTTSEIFNSWV